MSKSTNLQDIIHEIETKGSLKSFKESDLTLNHCAFRNCREFVLVDGDSHTCSYCDKICCVDHIIHYRNNVNMCRKCYDKNSKKVESHSDNKKA